MELRLASVLLIGSFAVFVLVLVGKSVDFRCTAGGAGRLPLGAGGVCAGNESDSTKSIAQFLKEKVDKGLSAEERSKELEGLDFSTQAILSQVVESLSAEGSKPWGLFNFNYGVARIVRRLVICSAYRTSLRDFTVITLSPDFTIPTSNPDFKGVPPKDPSVHRTCTWLADGSAAAPRFRSEAELNETGRVHVGNGAVNFAWIGEVHGTSYDVLLIHCSFPEPVGTDAAGGFLYLNITHGSGPAAPTELAPALHEAPEKTMQETYLYEADRKEFQYEFAYCSAPVFTVLTSVHVKQFLMYHHSLLGGNVHYFIYESKGIDDVTMEVLQPLIDGGIATVVNFRREGEYDTWYHNQDLAINDCLYRTRLLARWVLFWDMDEYLHIAPPLTLPALLQPYQDAPWISFGKIDFSLAHCTPNTSGDWAVERMLYREKNPICGESCNGDRGARKWMCNPRKVKAGRIHQVADYAVKGGVVLSTKDARINHYRGLAAPRGKFNCEHIEDSNSTLDMDGKTTLWRDDELASLVTSSLKSSAESLNIFGGSGR